MRGKVEILERRIEFNDTKFAVVHEDYEQAKQMFLMLEDISKQNSQQES